MPVYRQGRRQLSVAGTCSNAQEMFELPRALRREALKTLIRSRRRVRTNSGCSKMFRVVFTEPSPHDAGE